MQVTLEVRTCQVKDLKDCNVGVDSAMVKCGDAFTVSGEL